jgi:hypothetical protein
MPILQRIELSNFLNSGRILPWRPDWPHQVLNINGENAALNIPNGKGKSTMTTAILSMLTYHGKSLKDLRERTFAPVQTGYYTHIRIQVLIPMLGASGDLVAEAGGEIGGQPMVFGMYGYSGENEKIEFYSYQGTFDDAPVAHVNKHHHTLIADDAFLGQLKQCSNLFPSNAKERTKVAHVNKHHHTLIADDAFLGQLKQCSNLFPSNAKERTKRAWLSYVEDFFDMSSLKQQLIYQLMRGAEGGHGYFEVKPSAGMNYSAAVFYERLAPELLTDVMGELGEEGEHGIEDTIHEKVSKVIAAKHETERKTEELRRASNTLRELSGLLDASAEMKAAKQSYEEHRKGFSLEAAVLRNVVVDDPIPGVPRTPPESVPVIARAMVMQDGKWFLPDRLMAEFTGEQSCAVNQRAQDRNGLSIVQASKSQLVDFTCDIKIRDVRGKANQLYSRDSALGLLAITNNFARDWTREKAIEAVTLAFDWVEANADTNPARILKKQFEVNLTQKNQEREQLSNQYRSYQAEKDELINEQNQVGAQQAEYRRMAGSGLFTEEEMKSPAKTGVLVVEAMNAATKKLETHKDKVRELTGVYAAWKEFVQEHGETIQPGDQAEKIDATFVSAKKLVGEINESLRSARNKRKTLEKNKTDTGKRFEATDTKLKRYLKTLPASVRFADLFGDVSPVGMVQKVMADRDGSNSRLNKIKNERDRYSDSLAALMKFKSDNENIAPGEWLAQQLATWESQGAEIGHLKDDLSEAKLRRIALDEAVIVAGRVAREAATVAGGNQQPLHDAIANMDLDESRREKILTLFSALLHTPVYQSVGEAADAAKRLAETGIETPVFVYQELEEFCTGGEISLDAISSHTWLVGVRTRQVDCLLDKTLVEREKEATDQLILSLSESILKKGIERDFHSPESEVSTLARKADDAVKHGYEAKDTELTREQESLVASLPDLEAKASSESLEIIRQTEQHYLEFKGVTETDLRVEHQFFEEALQTAIQTFEMNEQLIVNEEGRLDAQQKVLGDASLDAAKVDGLRAIQSFIDHPSDNPSFMAVAVDTEITLSEVRNHPDQRSRFQFDLAEQFIKQSHDRPRQIEERLQHIKKEQAEIQDRLIPVLDNDIQIIQGRSNELVKQVMAVDEFVRNLIRKYREFAAEQNDLVPISKEQIEFHALGGAAIGLRDDATLSNQVNMLIDIANDIELDESGGLKAEMNEARSRFASTKQAFAAKVEKILVMGDLDMSEPVKLELQRAKENPSVIDHLHAVAASNYERNNAANKTAASYLEDEWNNIGKWLKAFTQRLPDNLRTMKDVFSPAKDKVSGEYLSAGFEIEAKLADQEDVKTILDDVIKMVEKFETTRHAMENAAQGLRDQAIRSIRTEIRTTFYQRVILNPRIRAYMPSIAKRPLPLEKNMVSTGQGVAMTLLWIVKMADYVTERELRRVTTSRAQQRRLHPTQFAIMDGAFSSLSNKGLIKDALDCIKTTRGRFQLIITGHDENYQNNFEYFPTLIEAREIDGRFMYADSETRRILPPEQVGSHYGAIGVMNLRVKPLNDAEAAAG